MTGPTSFVKLTAEETALKDWEVLSDEAGFRFSDLLVLGILAVVLYLARDLVTRMLLISAYEVPLLQPLVFPIFEWTGPLLFHPWTPAVLALVWMGAVVLGRPDVKGHVVLTNWRFLYYERGEGRWRRSYHRVISTNLEDVVGIHSVYSEGLWGRKNLVVSVHTKHKEGVAIRIGETGLPGRIPGIGRWFGKNTIGDDAFAFLPVGFRLIQESRGRMGDPSISY